jgi:hypothetical protein
MWMHAGCGRKTGPTARQRGRALTARDRFADHHDVGDAGSGRVGQHCVTVRVERRVTEMAVGVD